MKTKRFSWDLILVIIAGVFLLGPSIFNFFVNREIISIAYQTDTCNNMIALSPKIKEKVKITFDEQDAKSAFFYNVRIENDGNKAIDELPITIVVNDSVEISDIPEITTIPEIEFGEVRRDIQHSQGNKLRYTISLFNPKDVIVFKFLGFSKAELISDIPKIYAKISNLKIHSKSERPKKRNIFDRALVVLGIINLILAIIIFIRKKMKQGLLKELFKKEKSERKNDTKEIVMEEKKEFPKKSNSELKKEQGKEEAGKTEAQEQGENKPKKTVDDAFDVYMDKKEEAGDIIFKELIEEAADIKEKLYLQARQLYLKSLTINTKYIDTLKEMSSKNTSEFWPTYYFGLGCYYQIKDYSLAEIYLTKARNIAPDDSKKIDCLTLISDCLIKLKKIDNALQLLWQEYKDNKELNDKKKSELLLKIGDIYKDQGELQKYFINYEEALRLDPLDDNARFNLALSYSNNAYNKLAAYHYSQNCNLKNEDTTAGEDNNIALIFSGLNLPIKSIEHFKKAIKEGNSKAVSNLADRLLKSGFIEEANGYLQKDIQEKKEKTDERVHYVLSELESKKKNEEEKVKQLYEEADLQRRYHIRAFESIHEGDLNKFSGNWRINNISFSVSIKGNRAQGIYKKDDWDSVEIEGEVRGKVWFFIWKEKGFTSIKDSKGTLILINDNRMEGYIEKAINDIGVTSEIFGERI